MKKILALLLSSTTGLTIIAIIILVPILMIMDFFGANITDGYVEDNMEYAEQYKSVNQNLKNPMLHEYHLSQRQLFAP